MRKDLMEIRNQLKKIAEDEAIKLYRLARRSNKHGLPETTILEIIKEANELHTTGYPERLADLMVDYNFKYAFKF